MPELISKTRKENKYKVYKNCLRCNSPNNSYGWKYCSPKCRKLFLKSEYRKRNPNKISEYKKTYRKRGIDPYQPTHKTKAALNKKYNNICYSCSSTHNLQAAHIKPHWAGGSNRLDNLLLLCKACHHEFDTRLRAFWLSNKDI